MKKYLLLTGFLVASSVSALQQITGAGSSFVYPVLAKWAQTYNNATQIEINYQPIGSGGGIRAIETKTVSFAATDKPLTIDELKKDQLVQAPLIIGGIVPIINLGGIDKNQLVLSGPVLANIYLGKINRWNDPAIKALNPNLTLPNKTIITVHRSDGSGTTFNFTNYLAKVSNEWKTKVGADTVVAWPGYGLGAKGNAGVASQVKNLPNSIGYVEYAYAVQNGMVSTKMKNQAGKVVAASSDTFAAAAKSARWEASNGFYLILTNQAGANTWPIVATTFVLIPKATTPQRDAALAFLVWAYKNGATMAANLDYVAIPATVYNKILADWKLQFKDHKS